MLIETTAPALLNHMFWLARISKDNDKPKSLLLEADELVKLYSSSSMFFGQAVLEAKAIEGGRSLLPLSVIEILKNIGDKVITVDLDLDRVVVKYNKRNRITIKQLAGSLDDVSVRDYEPAWMNTDISRLKNIRYASSDRNELDLLWFWKDSIVATNKIRVAVYKPGLDLGEYQMALLSDTPTYLPSDNIDIAFDRHIWLGRPANCISTTAVEAKLPAPLVGLCQLKDLDAHLTLSLEELKRIVAISKAVAKKTDYVVGAEIALFPDMLTMRALSPQADNDLTLEAVESSLNVEYKFKLNIEYLSQALGNCVGPQVQLGLLNYRDTMLTYVIDADITHYIINLF